MRDDLTTRLLAEIERRQRDAAGDFADGQPLDYWHQPVTAMLTALWTIVDRHRLADLGCDCCETCVVCRSYEWPCATVAAVGAALGVKS